MAVEELTDSTDSKAKKDWAYSCKICNCGNKWMFNWTCPKWSEHWACTSIILLKIVRKWLD